MYLNQIKPICLWMTGNDGRRECDVGKGLKGGAIWIGLDENCMESGKRCGILVSGIGKMQLTGYLSVEQIRNVVRMYRVCGRLLSGVKALHKDAKEYVKMNREVDDSFSHCCK